MLTHFYVRKCLGRLVLRRLSHGLCDVYKCRFELILSAEQVDNISIDRCFVTLLIPRWLDVKPKIAPITESKIDVFT